MQNLKGILLEQMLFIAKMATFTGNLFFFPYLIYIRVPGEFSRKTP